MANLADETYIQIHFGPLERVSVQDHEEAQTETGQDQEVTHSSMNSNAGTDKDNDVDFNPNMVSWASIDPHHADAKLPTSIA